MWLGKRGAGLLVLLGLWSGCGESAKDSGGSASNNANSATNNGANSGNSANSANSNNPNSANSGNNATGGPCQDDAACGEAERCDVEAGVCRRACAGDEDCSSVAACGEGGFCVPLPTCAAQGECGEGQTCDTCAGRCARLEGGARPCQSDANCLFEEFCHPCLGVCQEVGGACDPCTEDFECGGGGNLCLDLRQGGRVCGVACADASDCPRGFGCEDVGGSRQCVPSSGDCANPGECAEDEDCPLGMRCGPLLTCVAGCTEGTCPNGEVCDAGSCKPPCATSADCVPGAECQPDGLCRVPGGCASSRDCPDAGTYCDLEQLMCVEGCRDDADCPGLQVCGGGQPLRAEAVRRQLFVRVRAGLRLAHGHLRRARGALLRPLRRRGRGSVRGRPEQVPAVPGRGRERAGGFLRAGVRPGQPGRVPGGLYLLGAARRERGACGRGLHAGVLPRADLSAQGRA